MADPTRKPVSSPDKRSSAREAALRVVRELQTKGHTAYFAGGCVRDELLGLDPKDFDIATSARPEEVREIFHRTRAVGEHFGVVLVYLLGRNIEVATFRTEWGYSDHRRPDGVEFSDAEHDARRRDFTINGLFEDPVKDEVIDYVNGRADLKAGIIRAIGTPSDRLAEDHLRTLRAVRFAARFGFAIELATAEAIRREAGGLKGISRERIGHELRGMLAHPARAESARLLQDLGLDVPVLALVGEVGEVELLHLTSLPKEADFPLALAAWALDRPGDAVAYVKTWRSSLVLSNQERDDFRNTLALLDLLEDGWGEASVARRKRTAAHRRFTPAMILLSFRDQAAGPRIERDVDELAASFGGIAPEPFVTGDDLIEMGLPPGPDFARILDRVYDAQLEGDLRSREEALDLAGKVSADA